MEAIEYRGKLDKVSIIHNLDMRGLPNWVNDPIPPQLTPLGVSVDAVPQTMFADLSSWTQVELDAFRAGSIIQRTENWVPRVLRSPTIRDANGEVTTEKAYSPPANRAELEATIEARWARELQFNQRLNFRTHNGSQRRHFDGSAWSNI